MTIDLSHPVIWLEVVAFVALIFSLRFAVYLSLMIMPVIPIVPTTERALTPFIIYIMLMGMIGTIWWFRRMLARRGFFNKDEEGGLPLAKWLLAFFCCGSYQWTGFDLFQ